MFKNFRPFYVHTSTTSATYLPMKYNNNNMPPIQLSTANCFVLPQLIKKNHRPKMFSTFSEHLPKTKLANTQKRCSGVEAGWNCCEALVNK